MVVTQMPVAITESSGGQGAEGSQIGIRPRSRRITTAILATLDHRRTWMLDNAALCEIAGVSERSLQVAFNEMFGEPPSVYLRKRALRRARRVLEIGLPGATSVSEIAIEHGFTHLGRFSRYYKELFGEAPSETLRRSPSPAHRATLIA